MKFKRLLAILVLSSSSFVYAADTSPTLKDSVDSAVKTAIEAAQEANAAAVEAHSEWFWASPIDDLWAGSNQTNTQIIEQAVTMANEGQNALAKKTAQFIENAAKQSLLQVEKAKLAGPALYGL